MKSHNDDTFTLQRLYEKWVVKDEWLLDGEAVPLLLGLDPETDFSSAVCESLRLNAHAAVAQGSLMTTKSDEGAAGSHTVKPAVIYHWAMANRQELPIELVNLMEFVLKTTMSLKPEACSQKESAAMSDRRDTEQLLGACFAIVATYPDECKNKQGVIKTERVLRLLDQHSDKLFNGQLPELSSTAIRDMVNHWILKLR
jgi:hypothetical protein